MLLDIGLIVAGRTTQFVTGVPQQFANTIVSIHFNRGPLFSRSAIHSSVRVTCAAASFSPSGQSRSMSTAVAWLAQ